MSNRLPLILLLFPWLCSGPLVFAQNAGNLPLVGVLRINTSENVEPFPTIFRNTLAALGRIEGQNIRIELRLAEGHAERFPELAQALVREKASVIVASGDAAVRAAQRVTQTIPIVALVDDIVAAGLISSLTKPGGNTTGVSILSSELDSKRLEILKQLGPSASSFRVSMFAAQPISLPLLLPSTLAAPMPSTSSPRRCCLASAPISARLV